MTAATQAASQHIILIPGAIVSPEPSPDKSTRHDPFSKSSIASSSVATSGIGGSAAPLAAGAEKGVALPSLAPDHVFGGGDRKSQGEPKSLRGDKEAEFVSVAIGERVPVPPLVASGGNGLNTLSLESVSVMQTEPAKYIRLFNGGSYTGETLKDDGKTPHGKGKVFGGFSIRVDGLVCDYEECEGNFENGFPNGQVTITFKNGCYFEGVVEMAQLVEGTMSYPKVDVFKGKWDQGKQAQGTLTKADGSVLKGTFKNGRLMDGTHRGRDVNGHLHNWQIVGGYHSLGCVIL